MLIWSGKDHLRKVLQDLIALRFQQEKGILIRMIQEELVPGLVVLTQRHNVLLHLISQLLSDHVVLIMALIFIPENPWMNIIVGNIGHQYNRTIQQEVLHYISIRKLLANQLAMVVSEWLKEMLKEFLIFRGEEIPMLQWLEEPHL